MFFVIDKSKIFSYVIAICTVIILFVAASGLNDMANNKIVETSSNITEENKVNFLNEVDNIIK